MDGDYYVDVWGFICMRIGMFFWVGGGCGIKEPSRQPTPVLWKPSDTGAYFCAEIIVLVSRGGEGAG